MNPYKPRTRFGMDRLRETKWEDREHIQAVVMLEQFARKGGPNWNHYAR